MNFIRKFMGSTTTDELSSIQQGKFFLTRSPKSPKGSSECLYNDALITIKRTTREFGYSIVVTRIYEEGELNLKQDSDDEDEDPLDGGNKDEWAFIISPDLAIQVINWNGRKIVWNDIDGDVGDKFEFVIDEEIRSAQVKHFEKTLKKINYEVKYLKSYDSDDEGEESEEEEEADYSIDDVKNDILQYNNSFSKENVSSRSDQPGEVKGIKEEVKEIKEVKEEKEPKFQLVDTITSGPSVFTSKSSFHVYDALSSIFKYVDDVEVKIISLPQYQYCLQVNNGDNIKFETTLSSSMNPVFNPEVSSFVYSFYNLKNDKLSAYTFLIKFNDWNKFQTSFMTCLWESINGRKQGEEKNDFLVDSFNNMAIDSDDDYKTPPEYNDSEEDDYDDDEEEEDGSDVEPRPGKVAFSVSSEGMGDFNSGINVGYTNDRSYVVRGNNLGIFKMEDGGDVEFQTTISNLKNKQGKSIIPKKLMLHDRDQHMVLKSDDDKKVYRMDMNRGQIVEEWDVNEVVHFEPSKKLDPLTGKSVFSGISSQAVFDMDPRIKEIVTNNAKNYKTKTDFSHLITTESGHLAIASKSGELRLYDRIGVNAKTLIPSLGDVPKGMDISNDGRWLLTTYDNYLLLMDCKIGKGQRNEGKLGFEKSFNAEAKPVPRRLQLKPQHMNIILNSEGTTSLNFTTAFFNTGLNHKETHIITSSGKYLISWNIKKFLNGKEPNYLVKKYSDAIVGNKFKFNSDEIVIALENDVGLVNKNRFRQFK
ncbi:vacuolar import and degradation protein 27 [[Candida] jaroonii]|uniref:Vacuolar import and degradation protein 27 n=1 Tax=[Candida] jaroonii TaxID=467808 RepID=A0ACA9Y9R6_9ASCO|nr:vacuolar import and degradation protein 27 [[Candida] jaroonii]